MRIIFSVLILLSILVLNVFSAMAITGAIGNARMVLRAETGESLKKSVLIKNVNDVPVEINLVVEGDLKDNLKLEEDNFKLPKGEDKKVYFTIKANKPGTYETKINVAFSPLNGEKSGVGLSSTIILTAYGEGEFPDDGDGSDSNGDNDYSDGNSIVGNLVNVSDDEEKPNSVTVVFLVITLILVLSLVVLLVMYNKSKQKNKKNKK